MKLLAQLLVSIYEFDCSIVSTGCDFSSCPVANLAIKMQLWIVVQGLLMCCWFLFDFQLPGTDAVRLLGSFNIG